MNIRWYADQVERVTFSDKVLDNPKYRLQYWDGENWLDVPCFVSKNATVIDVDLRTPEIGG